LFKLRGKVISLHSQAITEWCLQYGAYNLRLKLVKFMKSDFFFFKNRGSNF